MLNLRLISHIKFLLDLILILFFSIVLLLVYTYFFPGVVYAESSLSVMELDGWTKAPDSNLLDFPYDVFVLYLFINVYTIFSFIPLGVSTSADVGTQFDTVSDVFKLLESISNSISEANISFDSLSTALSDIPSIPNSADIYPALLRNTDLNNAFKAQEIYTELLNAVDPNVPQFEVYKRFLSFAKRIFYNALSQGLEPGTVEFSQYFFEEMILY